MKAIKRNAIRCKKCGDIIESKNVHDFKMCSCQSSFVDGGHQYIRIGGNLDDIEILTEYVDVPGYHVAYRSKWTKFIEPYETDLAEPLEKIYKRFPKHLYDLRITEEDGTVVIDTITDNKGN